MKDKNQKNPPKDWWEAGDIFISIGMALLLLVAQILYTHQSCQPPRQTFWLGCSTPGTTGIEGGVLSAVMVFALSIIPSVLFLIISRAHYQLRLRLHELSHLNETIEASKSITTLVNFSNAYLRALHPLGTPYQSTIRALVDEGAVKHISYVPNVYLHEYYDRLGHALEHARTWAAIHQGLPKGLGNDANVLPTTLEGRMTASYFAAQKRAHDRRADLRRCIILADDEVQEFFERRNYDAFWKLTGKYVKCYLCLEQDLVGLVQGFNLQDIRDLDDFALYDDVFALYFRRPSGPNKPGTLIFDHGRDGLTPMDEPLLPQTRLVQKIFARIDEENQSGQFRFFHLLYEGQTEIGGSGPSRR